MSQTPIDNALFVIPRDMFYRPDEERSEAALALFMQLFPGAEHYQAETFEQVHFIHPGALLCSAVCPVCGEQSILTEETDLEERQWLREIDRISFEQSIEGKDTVLPACGHRVPLIGLCFDSSAGYARYALTARYGYWILDWEIGESPPAEFLEKMAAIEQVLGVPVKCIQSIYSLLPSDQRMLESLMSVDDEQRLAATVVYSNLADGHFEQHSIHSWFIEDNLPRLLAAYDDTHHSAVRRLILNFIANAHCVNEQIISIASASLDPDCEVMTEILYLIYACSGRHGAARFQHLAPSVKQLHNHPDQEVRWRCAMTLRCFPVNYAQDVEIIQKLMLDDHYATRTEAILLFQKALGDRLLSVDDRAILERSIEKDGTGAAAYYAKELLTRGTVTKV